MHFAEYESPVGTLLLQSDDGALTGLTFAEKPSTDSGSCEVLRKACCWLDAYFRGETQKPDFPVRAAGTAFQRLVWEILLTIPYGQVRTYGDIAAEAAGRLGKEKMSAQAVGQAVGANPISILIPCHRCVGAKGQLTGYAWGIERKKWLLQHEKENRK